jgi:RNA polymerase sigma-70 factor (ECF subfamily)
MFTHAELLKETQGLHKFALKLTRNADDADDLLQSTIVTALNKQEQFERGTNLFGWTSRIMFNAFVSSYRHNSRFETQFDPQVYIDQEFIDGPQESETDLDLVLEAMMSLSEDHREILRMVCIDGMKYAEVSKFLDIPVGTVRSRLSRARDSLQEQLELGRDYRVTAPSLNKPARRSNELATAEQQDVAFAIEQARQVAAGNLVGGRA